MARIETERNIVHCDLDTFFVSVERLLNSDLVGKPVLIGGSSDRGVVASCSYEDRRFGIHSAMPMKLALRLCPEAVLVRGDHDLYSKYSNLVTQIIEDSAPVVEKASIDEHYIDITGMDRFFGCWKWTRELRQRIINESGLPVSFGLSTSKTVSKIATGEAKPCGEQKVDSGKEKPFFAPLTVSKIPMVGEKTAIQLGTLGISHIHMIQQMQAFTMRRVFGQNGVMIWMKANGLDDSPVVPFHEQKSMSKETTFQADTIDMGVLKRTLIGMVDTFVFTGIWKGMYIPFEQLTLAILRQELKDRKRYFVIQRFQWFSVAPGKGFMVTSYVEEDRAKEHAAMLEANEGKLLDAYTSIDKIKNLLAKGSGYRLFLNRIKDQNWNDRMLRFYEGSIISFLKWRTTFRRRDHIDILFTMKHGRVMAEITNGKKSMEVQAFELIK